MKKVNTKIVIEELHRAFNLFNKELFNGVLPEPAILVQSRGNKKLCLGWCTVNKVWKNEITQEEKYEINLVAEGLNRGIYPVMATLLHEMVHLHNLVMGIKDTSRGNTYHNMKFKQTAEQFGLMIEHADKIGWSLTSLQSSTMDLIDSARFNEDIFKFARRQSGLEKDKPRKKVKSSIRKYVCPTCGCIIRASKLVNVICGDCLEQKEIISKFVCEEPVEVDDEVEKVMKDYVCTDCGCVQNLPEGTGCCPECAGELLELPTKQPIDEPIEIEDIPAEPTTIEVDDELVDGDGKLVPVKQGMFEDVEKKANTGWGMDRLIKELTGSAVEGEAVGLESCFPNGVEIEISDKLNSQWAKYVEGKKIVFSKNYLETASDEEIMDTLKHEYLHHYQYTVQGLKVNHKKDFKALCDLIGISKEVPSKNHRAMK